MNITWNPSNPDSAIRFGTLDGLFASNPELFAKTWIFEKDHPLDFCKVMLYQGELSGVFVIPKKSDPIVNRMTFGFILKDETLWFIGDVPKTEQYVRDFMSQYSVTIDSPYQFLLRLMNYVISQDLYFLEAYNKKLQEIEEDVYEGRNAGMERFIMSARKDMNILENYYLQISAMGESMQQIVIPHNNQDENAMISLFLTRAGQLLNLVGEIKDYTNQIWNLRQTQLSDRQNKISTLLTICSTIFLPLTFITGWYGMNFKGMPLIESDYGYPIILAIVAAIILFELHFIRSRHWLDTKEPSISRKEKNKLKKDEKNS